MATLGVGATLNNPIFRLVTYFKLVFVLSTASGSFMTNLVLLLQTLSA